jgi:hypothetical protein
MWPFKTKPTAFEVEFAEVQALPESTAFDNVTSRIYPIEVEARPPIDPPIPQVNDQSIYARPAQIDKFPTVIGANLTGQYVSSAFRLCNSGWRYQYVDLLDELLENDPDTRAVVRARILGVACGRYTIEPAELGLNATDAERDLASAIAADFDVEWQNIPYLRQRIQQLAWADWYGLSGLEIKWEHPESNRWEIADLSFIHSRRLNLTNPNSWDVFIYDQGLVGPGPSYMGPTTGVYGLPVAKFPGQFIKNTPSLSGQYPTRDGEGRYVAFFMLLKRMVERASAQDFERVIRPWVIGYFNRKMPEGSDMPLADKLDIQLLQQSLQALGSGSMNSAALPNSVKIEILKSAAAMSATEFLSFLNRSIAKALLGQAFTTEPGPNGNMATAEVADKNTGKILEYSVGAMCDTWRACLAIPWLQLNHPGLSRRFAPRIVGNVSDLPKPAELMIMAAAGARIDMPIDIDDLAARTHLKVLEKDDTKGRRTRIVSEKAGPNPGEDGEPIQQKTDAPKDGKLVPINGKNNAAPSVAANKKP